jgi:hypothetical protein
VGMRSSFTLVSSMHTQAWNMAPACGNYNEKLLIRLNNAAPGASCRCATQVQEPDYMKEALLVV